MSYMKIGNTHIRENGHKINVFKKVDEIKQELKVAVRKRTHMSCT